MPDAALKLFTFEHHATTTSSAHHSYVGSGTSNGPHIIAAGMFLPEADLHTYNHGDSLHRGYEPLR